MRSSNSKKLAAGQHVVGELGGVGRKQIERHGEQILALERAAQLGLPRAGRQGVHVPYDQGLRAARILEHFHQVHVAHGGRRRAREMCAGQVGLVDPPLPEVAVEVQQARSRLAQVAGDRGQERAGAHHVAAGGLALQTLAEPEERGAGRIEVSGLLDQRGGHAGRGALLGEIQGLDLRRELVPALDVRRDERLVEQPVALNHVQQRERQRRVAAGKRLQVHIRLRRGGRAHRIDDDHFSGRLGQPVLVGVRRGRVGIRAPDDDARRMRGGARIETVERRAVHIAQRHVPGHVADGIGRHLRRPQAIEEAHRREAGEQRDGAGVMRVQDRPRAVRGGDPLEARGDLADRRLPAHGLEARAALSGLGPHAAQGLHQPPLRIAPLAVVGGRALAAQGSAAHRMVGIAAHRDRQRRRASRPGCRTSRSSPADRW